jgi:hypothetical protein
MQGVQGDVENQQDCSEGAELGMPADNFFSHLPALPIMFVIVGVR